MLPGLLYKTLVALTAAASAGVGSPNPIATAANSQVKISWAAATQSILGVAVEESLDSGNSWITAVRLPPNSTHVSVQNLINGKSYWFRLRWIWLDNSLSIPSPTLVEIPINSPNVPTGLVGTANATQIGLSWDRDSNKFIIGYEIDQSIDGGNTWLVIQANTGSASSGYLINNAKEGTTYTYRIRALGFGGVESDYSDSAVVKISKAPTGGYGLTYSIVNSKVTLKWETPTDLPDIQSYEVRISGDGGVNWFKIATTQGNVNSTTVPYVIGGSTYQVTATSVEGLTSVSQVQLVQTNAISNPQNTLTSAPVPNFGSFAPTTSTPTSATTPGSNSTGNSPQNSKIPLPLILTLIGGVALLAATWLAIRSRRKRSPRAKFASQRNRSKKSNDKPTRASKPNRGKSPKKSKS